MKPAILGKKIGMTQVYDERGVLYPVTVVQAGPCSVLQIKTVESDGYNAVQVGFDDVKASRATKPHIGHVAKATATPKAFVREVRLDDAPDLACGDEITVELFAEVKAVDVTGTTKGRGYSGGMRRHGFMGQPASHGVERKHRSPGSLTGHATNRGWSGRIKKGKRMAGQYGNVRRTTRNLKLVGVDRDNHLLLIGGAIPGPANSYVMVRQSNKIG